MSEATNAPETLRESIIKRALKTLDWTPLEEHLAKVELDQQSVAELVAHVRRSSDFLIKRPDPKREKRRAEFLKALTKHLSDHVGSEAVEVLNDVITMIQQIEAGYSEILGTLQATLAANLLPEVQASAALYRAAFAYHDMAEAFKSDVKSRKELALQSFRLKREDGSTYSPDGVISEINGVTTMTLLLLGHQHKWFDSSKYLVIPNLTVPTDDDVYKVGETEVLAMSWRRWERMEQRCRYFEGSLKISRKGSLPDWLPAGSETLVSYDHISQAEYFDYIANQRLSDRLVQTFQEMLLQTNMLKTVAGIANPLGLPPDGLVSALEGHACISLSEVLGYAIVDDQETPCGLRLVEWIRGYAVLQLLAEERYERLGKVGLYSTLERTRLTATLERLGLTNQSAGLFIDLASLQASSRDMFDQPLVRMQDGSLLLFGPGILNADPVRLTLSAIGNKGEQLSRKGKAFESEILKFFQDNAFEAKTLKFKGDGEEYEYDVLLSWGDHIFIFECKNRTLSGNNPIASYYFAIEMESAERQVLRLAGGLVRHADMVRKQTGIDVTKKFIVPCVLNSMPYSVSVEGGGAYFSDASSLKRFFQERYFHAVRQHHVHENVTVLHRNAMQSLWSDEKPTPFDLVAYLAKPLQLQLAMAHTARIPIVFWLGGRTMVTIKDVAYQEMTSASIAKLFSVNIKCMEREVKAVKRAVAKVRRKAKRRKIIEADRAWRANQQRKSPRGEH